MIHSILSAGSLKSPHYRVEDFQLASSLRYSKTSFDSWTQLSTSQEPYELCYASYLNKGGLIFIEK